MSPLSEEDPGYIKIPSSEDRVHCLVSVMPADKMAFLGKHVIQKMRDIRLAAADMGKRAKYCLVVLVGYTN